jgi:hypothetical protein
MQSYIADEAAHHRLRRFALHAARVAAIEALTRLIKILGKLPTGDQPFRQKPGGLKPDCYDE